jgi:hypothetical protein
LPAEDPVPLSTPLRTTLSAIVVVHFGLVAIHVLSEFSGPWPNLSRPGQGPGAPPAFITEGMVDAAQSYTNLVRLGETGRFPSIRWQPLQVKVEAVLYDESGKEIGVKPLPDPDSTPWNRARENMLAQALANDMERMNPGNEAIYPAGQEPPKVPVWRPVKPDDPIQVLTYLPEHLLSREFGAPDWGPSEWGLTLSRSYAVHLCRSTGAASVEIRRKWRNQILPAVIESEIRPPNQEEEQMFGERVSTYGKVSDVK